MADLTVDGTHFAVRLDQDWVRTVVITRVRTDGKQELVALADEHRESTEPWAGPLRDGNPRGMQAPPPGCSGEGTVSCGGSGIWTPEGREPQPH